MNIEFNDGNIDAVFWEEVLETAKFQNTVVPDCLKPKLKTKGKDRMIEIIEEIKPLSKEEIQISKYLNYKKPNQELLSRVVLNIRTNERYYEHLTVKQTPEGNFING